MSYGLDLILIFNGRCDLHGLSLGRPTGSVCNTDKIRVQFCQFLNGIVNGRNIPFFVLGREYFK